MNAVETWIRDFRHSARSLARTPGFTLTVVATLALAIGANASIFSVVKVVLLEPLPFPNADRLVHIGGTAPGTDQPEEFGVPDELYFAYRESVPGIEDAGIYGTGSSTTRAEGQVDQLFVTQATPSFFTTLGAVPLHGRLPTDNDDGRVVVLSHWLWQNWFNSDEKVIGKSYSFAGQNRQVIGVMKPEFRFPDERVAFWVPLAIRAAQVTPGGFGPRMVARMKPGTDRAALVAQLEPLARQVQQRLGGPAPYVQIMERHRPVVKPLREQTGRQDLDATLDSARHGRHRLPRRVRQRGEPVHGASGEPARRTVGAPRARRWTRRPRASASDRGAPSRGGRRRGRRGHRVGRRPTPGPRGA